MKGVDKGDSWRSADSGSEKEYDFETVLVFVQVGQYRRFSRYINSDGSVQLLLEGVIVLFLKDRVGGI